MRIAIGAQEQPHVPCKTTRPNGCGILHYCSNSRIIHLTASHSLGPYKRSGIALEPSEPPAWDSGAVHGPTIHRLRNGTWVLYYMGTNNTWDPLHGTHPNCSVTPDPQRGSRASRRIGVATATSLYGPWMRRSVPVFGPSTSGAWDWLDVSNPTPIIFANLTTVLLYKGRGHIQAMGAAKSDHFAGPFVRVRPEAPVLSAAVEDTWAWVQPAARDRPEVLHTLSHVGNGAHAAGGHAWSLDGVSWVDTTVARGGAPSYTGRVHWADGSTTILARRERPQILLRHPAGERRGGPVGVPEVVCTSAQLSDSHSHSDRHCTDGGQGEPEDCKTFTMCETIELDARA